MITKSATWSPVALFGVRPQASQRLGDELQNGSAGASPSRRPLFQQLLDVDFHQVFGDLGCRKNGAGGVQIDWIVARVLRIEMDQE